MHLWNDYEGKTIAEAYPLEKLLRPEGRSAFFVTPDEAGAPNVIRLTESLNDEHEMLERWRQVSEVHQENLVAIKTYGQTTFDGVPLAYALMEPTDGSLAEILAERPLTAAETQEVAGSLVAALSALHEMDLIHEHIEAANVLASGDVIKLRSDCIRKCIEDGEFNTPAMCAALKQKDVRDLAALLLRCLTLEKMLAPMVKLAAPFDRIVPNGLNGSWGLAEISGALNASSAKPSSAGAMRPLPAVGAPVEGGFQARTPAVASPRVSGPQVTSGRTPVQADLPFAEAGDGPTLRVRRVEEEPVSKGVAIPRSWMLAGAATALVLLLAWFLVPAKNAETGKSVPVADSRIATIDDAPDGKPVAAAPAGGAVPSAVALVSRGKSGDTPTAVRVKTPVLSAQGGWRVVCYTFSHEDQAWTRAGAIHKAHPGLNAQVVSESSHGPFLVALGGGMSKGEAETVLQRARRAGMPRDMFTRFYPAR